MPIRFEDKGDLPSSFFAYAARCPDEIVYSQLLLAGVNGTPAWRAVTYREAAERIHRLAVYLRSLGFKRGYRAAIIASARPEWIEADLAILAAGGIVVSVYQTLPADEMGYILHDSGSEVVFVEERAHYEKLRKVIDHGFEAPAVEDRPAGLVRVDLKQIISFEKLGGTDAVWYEEALEQGRTGRYEPERMAAGEIAALVYTSGTTGPPKGVIQTHGNHLANITQTLTSGLIEEGDDLFLFLPLAHSFAKLMGYLGFLTGVGLKFPAVTAGMESQERARRTTADLREAGATVIPVVPRILEKMQSGIEARAHGVSPAAVLLRAALWAARRTYTARAAGKRPGLLVQMVYEGTAAIRAAIKQNLFGARFRFAVSGGAKLRTSVNEFFDALGIEVVEGYGLTETCVATNCNRPGGKRIGTVGPQLCASLEMRLAEDGEVLFRGPNVAQGYYRRPQATQEAWDADGWFHTGDLGALDSDGFLRITGRKKDLIITSYGKNVAPEPIEQQLITGSYIAHAVLIGDDRPYCVALLTLHEAVVRAWAAKQNLALPAELHRDERIFKLVWGEVEKVNQGLATYEQIKKAAIVPGDFTIENSILTPTLKVRRSAVADRYHAEIEAMYAAE